MLHLKTFKSLLFEFPSPRTLPSYANTGAFGIRAGESASRGPCNGDVRTFPALQLILTQKARKLGPHTNTVDAKSDSGSVGGEYLTTQDASAEYANWVR